MPVAMHSTWAAAGRILARTRYKCQHQAEQPLGYTRGLHNSRCHPMRDAYSTGGKAGDGDVAAVVSELVRLLSDRHASATDVWGSYDRLKMRRLLQFLPHEAWGDLLRICQQAPVTGERKAARGRAKSSKSTQLFPLKRPQLSTFAREFAGRESAFWTRSMARRRAQLVLSDMHRCGCTMVASHYNVALDVICRDEAASVSELMAVHDEMRLRGVREDTVTFNTLLNGCRRLGAWKHFREIEAHMAERDAWGVTAMDATTWGTLLQGYSECADWEAADRCVRQIVRMSRAWRDDTSSTRFVPTTQLWSIVVAVYAQRDMVPQMISARKTLVSLGLEPNAHTFAPVFAALHRQRKTRVHSGQDVWPTVELAVEEYEAMRAAAVKPNAIMLTNILLTIALARSSVDGRLAQKLLVVSGAAARELEAMLVSMRDSDAYTALLNISGRAGNSSEVRGLWQTLLAEERVTDSTAPPVLTSRTLAAYINALGECRAYSDAIAAFYEYALPLSAGSPGRAVRVAPPPPRLAKVELPVFEAGVRMLAHADRHNAIPHVVRAMIARGLAPSALVLRYMLLAPDQSTTTQARLQRYTRPWSLPLGIAREVWGMTLAQRRSVWMTPHRSGLPVIVNDIAAQLIRIAAYARDVRFGKAVFDALACEAKHYAIGHGSANAERRAALPPHMQCAPNLRTYTSMITLYANDANIAGVSRMWAAMLRDQIEPNIKTYTSLIVCLHKVALRKRWRSTQELSEQKTADGTLELGPGAHVPWETTSQDDLVTSLENWIVGEADPPTELASIADAYSGQASAAAKPRAPSLDIPLSTLLLHYHAMRIRDAHRRTALGGSHSISDELILLRAMRVCQAVEGAKLVPDRRFHVALADLFEAHGDHAGAELVLRHITNAVHAGSDR
ncbi:hypothetical protein GGI07_005564 [Coemansia sp. Benny D115]|nr:hypothetical protein GGI07_005564 [Coemansia sp. Benny D115]